MPAAEPACGASRFQTFENRVGTMSDTVIDPWFPPPEDAVAFYDEALRLLKTPGETPYRVFEV